jgi:CheY-like chemotaxis protein
LKDQFLAIVSHELRTPLNAILGWADMLRSDKLDETRRQRASQVIFDSAQRQAKLIDDLVDVARIMSGKLRLERTFVDLEDVVRAAVNVMQPAADAKRIQIAFGMDSSVGAIYGDRARLQQITWNLLSNAIKFTPEEGAVSLRLQRAGDSIDVIVTDTGQGIPERFKESVFEPFRQADGSTTRHHGGLGLGLSIVKHLAEAHGGAVSVHSGGEGQGATFTVRLPIAPASAEQAAIQMAEHPTPAARSTDPPTLLEGLSVLVIDDDEESRQVVAAQLEGHRASVLTAASAAEGLDLLLRERVDVLLADIAMPDEDGYALIRHIRGLHPSAVASIPAAAVTAFARNEDRLQALQAGFQLHLAKPLDLHTLVTAVARLGGRMDDRRQSAALLSPGPAGVQ